MLHLLPMELYSIQTLATREAILPAHLFCDVGFGISKSRSLQIDEVPAHGYLPPDSSTFLAFFSCANESFYPIFHFCSPFKVEYILMDGDLLLRLILYACANISTSYTCISLPIASILPNSSPIRVPPCSLLNSYEVGCYTSSPT